MRVTVIAEDQKINIDGEVYKGADADFTGFHAIQWDGEKGHIERKNGPNEVLTDPDFVQPYIDAWQKRRAELGMTPKPSLNEGERAVNNGAVKDSEGNWVTDWIVESIPHSELWPKIRKQRDSLLSQTDWAVLPDAPLTSAQVDEVKTYRQSLREIPQSYDDPDAVEWPSKPEGINA